MRLTAGRPGVRLGRAAACGVLVPLVLLPASPAQAEEGSDCSSLTDAQTVSSDSDSESLPAVDLDISGMAAAMPDGAELGTGVTVAVLDSGIADPAGALGRVDGTNVTGKKEIVDWHGTAVAGLVSGAPQGEEGELTRGVAPGASVMDVRVFDSSESSSEDKPVTTASVTEGLEWVLNNAPGVEVVVVASSVPPGNEDPKLDRLRAVVAQLAERAVIVAASGNRPASDAPELSEFATPAPGQDAAKEVFPAGYGDDVLAVSATAAGSGDVDPSAYVLPNSQIDVAVPTANAISYGLNGRSCRLPDVATSWATGIVGGIVAGLRSAHPDDTPQQTVARIKSTASGSVDQPTLYSGAGVVQPVEAMTRPLRFDGSGRVEEARLEARAEKPLTIAPEEADPLADLRDDLVWWGLLAGGVLGVAALVRPLLLRRNRDGR